MKKENVVKQFNLENLLLTLPSSVSWKDKDGVYQGCNDRFVATLGFLSAKEIIGKTDFDLANILKWTPEVAESFYKIDREILESGISKMGIKDIPFTNLEGCCINQITNKSPLYDCSKNIVGLVAVSFDISYLIKEQTDLQIAKKYAEKNTIDTLKNIDGIMACMPGSIYWKDKDGVYQGCNDSLAQLVGIPRAKIIGKTDYDFAKKLGWPDKTVESFRETDNKVLNSGLPRLNVVEQPFRSADGRLIVQLTNKVPLRNEAGYTVGVLGISIDITERIRMEEALEKAKIDAEKSTKDALKNLDGILACMPGSVFWKDKDGVYQGCNDVLAQLIGIPRAEIIGKTDYDFAKKLGWSNETVESFRETDNKVLNSGLPRLNIEEEPFRCADEKVIVQLTSKVPLINEEGKSVGVLGISIDITKRKKMEEELLQAKKATESANYIMTEFISNMGHDLTTPLSDIGGIAEIFKFYIDEYPELKDLIETLAKRYTDCEKVRDRIINATSIANLEVKHETFSITQVLLDLENALRPSIGTKNLKIIIHPPTPKKEDIIETDREKFYAILFDLVSNAINFTEAGHVTISVLKKDHEFIIQVIDTGIGIPADKYDYIFEQYTKLSRSNQYGANFKGVGAGLYLARLRANILSATISVESEINKGSTFTLSIPAHSVKN